MILKIFDLGNLVNFLSILALILAFGIFVIEKKFENKKWMIVLSAVALTFQVLATILTSKEENQNRESIISKLLTNQSQLDSASNLIDVVVDSTIKQITLLQDVSNEIITVRKSTEQYLYEYQKINTNYAEQLQIEKQRLISEVPNVVISMPCSRNDTIDFAYQFTFENIGSRLADSLIFHSIMFFTDMTMQKVLIELPRDNLNSFNVQSVHNTEGKIINSDRISLSKLKAFKYGYLLIKYSYIDNLTHKTYTEPLKVYGCENFNKNKQFSQTVDVRDINKIKTYLMYYDRNMYNVFFQ
jgi:hypothetical protein